MTPTPVPRYLVALHPKKIPHHFVDVLVIGGGIAGMRATMALDPRLSALVVTKDQLQESASSYAQGGIAGVLTPEDCFANHIADTLAAGGPLCNPEVVEMVVREGPEHIRQLIEWGTVFDAHEGELLLGREGGHSHHRIAHAQGDATGQEIMRAMIAHARQVLQAQVWQNTFTIDLLTHEGACRGAVVWNRRHGKTFVWAKQTILCTGGVGQIFRETTNPPVATADGQACAYRAGAQLRDMEFMQFHPTVLYIAGSSRSLITEAIRGEGALLVDANSERFMPQYDPRAELAPRDIVSQAIVDRMEKTQHPCVYLDLSPLGGERARARFPGIASSCAKFGIDVAHDRIPVRPAAHYMIGGVQVDQQGRTTLPRLWAAGEVTSSGLHGANRLASNSLLEGLVYGAHAGAGASEAALSEADTYQAIPLHNAPAAHQAAEPVPGLHGGPPTTASYRSEDLGPLPLVANLHADNQDFHRLQYSDEPLDLQDLRNSLKSLMWRACGVRRTRDPLCSALETIDTWCQYALPRQFSDPTGWEFQNMLTIAQVMVKTALLREESRGVHLRSDFPDPNDELWKQHLTAVR